jgi:hypothetical protein
MTPRSTRSSNKITALDDAYAAREGAKGDCQHATELAITAFRNLNDWNRAFRRIARVALRHRKQLLEKLGITTRGSQRSNRKNQALTYDV